MGHKNRCGALSPLGTVLKARRLLLHASPAVAAPGDAQKNASYTGRQESAAVRHRDQELQAQRQVHEDKRRKKVVSAPYTSLAHAWESTDKHRPSKYKSARNGPLSSGMQSPGQLLHRNAVHDLNRRSDLHWHKADTDTTCGLNTLQQASPNSLVPADCIGLPRHQDLHHKRKRSQAQKRTQRVWVHQHIEPAPCTEMIQFPCSPLQHKHNFLRTGSMLLNTDVRTITFLHCCVLLQCSTIEKNVLQSLLK